MYIFLPPLVTLHNFFSEPVSAEDQLPLTIQQKQKAKTFDYVIPSMKNV